MYMYIISVYILLTFVKFYPLDTNFAPIPWLYSNLIAIRPDPMDYFKESH